MKASHDTTEGFAAGGLPELRFFGLEDDVVALDEAFGISVRHRLFLGLKDDVVARDEAFGISVILGLKMLILSLFFRDNLVGDEKVCVLLSKAGVGEESDPLAYFRSSGLS